MIVGETAYLAAAVAAGLAVAEVAAEVALELGLKEVLVIFQTSHCYWVDHADESDTPRLVEM